MIGRRLFILGALCAGALAGCSTPRPRSTRTSTPRTSTPPPKPPEPPENLKIALDYRDFRIVNNRVLTKEKGGITGFDIAAVYGNPANNTLIVSIQPQPSYRFPFQYVAEVPSKESGVTIVTAIKSLPMCASGETGPCMDPPPEPPTVLEIYLSVTRGTIDAIRIVNSSAATKGIKLARVEQSKAGPIGILKSNIYPDYIWRVTFPSRNGVSRIRAHREPRS